MAELNSPLSMTSLCVTSSIPEGLLDASARDLHRVLDGPTLIELDGGEGAPLFVSGLMHGNEDSGLVAIQKVLRNLSPNTLSRPLMLLIGNVAAARHGLRRLEGQPDYNRVWPGCVDHQGTDEARIIAEVHQRVVKRGAFAAIDIHNNTGRNPHYAVVCVEDKRVMALASLFAPLAVLFRGLPGTQTASFSGLIPALTVECGQSGNDANAQRAASLIEAVMSLESLEACEEPQDLTLFHTLGQVRVREDVALGRHNSQPYVALDEDIDLHNFKHLPSGFSFGQTNHPMPFEVEDEAGLDVAKDFFQRDGSDVKLIRSVVPAMLTKQERVIRQDCVCYLMEELRHKPPPNR